MKAPVTVWHSHSSRELLSVHVRYGRAARTSSSSIMELIAIDHLATALAAAVQHVADQACLERVERESHEKAGAPAATNRENRAQVAIHGVLPAHCGHQLVLLTCVEWCKAAHTAVIRMERAL